MSAELRCVSQGCNRKVDTYEKYDMNGYRFHTQSHQDSRPNAKTINTGVFTRGSDDFDYYGRLQKIYELTFNNNPEVVLKLVVFKCHWFDPRDGQRNTPSIGLVEVRPSTTYTGSDLFVVAHQAKQVYYLPYPCPKDDLKGWEVVFQVSPHGKLPRPSEDDYDNINPQTYEGIFYQEQDTFGDFDIESGVHEDLTLDEQTRGENITNVKDVAMLQKLQVDDDDSDDEPPPYDEHPPYSRDTDSDSDDEDPRHYEEW